jgi:diguanylate cyclase (GGDEF)-like protein/PAS domain S-box-containing protein
LTNKYVGLRLGAAFAVQIVILLGIAQLGLRRMQTIDETLGGITGRQLTHLQLARKALELSNDNNRIVMQILFVENGALVETLLAKRSENSKEITRLIEESERRCESKKERQVLDAVKRARKPYVESYLRAIHLLLDEGRHDEAEAVVVNETIPGVLKYHAAWNEFVEFQGDEVDLAVQEAQVAYAKARRLAVLLIGLAVVLALGIAVFTTRQVQKGYGQETSAREAVEFELQRSDERMRMAMEAATIGFWDWDIVKDEQVWSDTCKALHGLRPDSSATFHVLMDSVHPDDRKMMQDEIDAAIEEQRDYSLEFRVVWPDSSMHWQLARGRAFYDNGGRTIRMAGITMDIDKRKYAEERIHLQLAAMEAAANAIVITDSRGTIQWVNHAFTTMTGYSVEEVLGKNPRLLKSGKQPRSYYADLWSTVSSGKVWHGELINTRKDGTTYIEEMTITPLAQNVGQANWTHFIAIKQDITARKQAEKELRLTQFSVEHASENIFWANSQGHFVYVNKAACDSLGYSREELLSLSIPDLNPRFRKEEEWSTFWEELKRRGSITFEGQNTSKQGRVFPAEVTANYLEFDGQEYSFAFVRDITDRKLAEDRVQYLAFYDDLTGLPNRTLLQDRLAKALADARRQKYKIALLFLDLDRFKDINDSLGHSVGDILLQDVADRLKTWGREQDTLARLGGDEFLIMLTHVKDTPDAAVAAERLMDAMTAEFVVQGHSLRVSCSLGISIFPEHGADGESLIKNADAAMYSAKESGRNNFRFFTDDMNAHVVERLTLERNLRRALPEKELFLMYQPQMDIATGKIIGLEALIRWQHPSLGLVPPDKFIRIAENCGLIVPIGEWVLRTACSQARNWQDEGLPAMTVAVNVSAVQFRQEGFCELIGRVLHEAGLAPQYLELELTESLLLANADVTLSVLKELKSMGVTLAIDDFGTGYSSFSYLRQFRVSKLKIDRSFIRDVAVKPDDAAITTAIISMARSLNLKVIAEGVENEAQMAFLRAHQCDEIQGYYFSKPLTVDKVAAKLRGKNPDPHALAQASGAQS